MSKNHVCLFCGEAYIFPDAALLDGLSYLCLCGKKWTYRDGGWHFITGEAKDVDISQQKHYTQWKIQPITFIAANKLNFCQGNVIKYVMRYNQKNGVEDLKKAKVYIDYLIQELETGTVKP